VDEQAPLRVHGSAISYYTGKLEGYLRYKERPYQLVPLGPRQMRRIRDGVSRATRAHVEGVYLKTLDHLEAAFAERPYLLGARPTLADFGFFASMFRHDAEGQVPFRGRKVHYHNAR
jgi:glutathione S-transferase